MSGNRKQSYLQHKNYNMSVIEEFFNILAPHQCVACHAEGSLLCQMCTEKINKVPERCYACGRWSERFRTCRACRRRSPLYSVRTVTAYEGAAKDLLHAVKFARARAGAGVMAAALAATGPLSKETLITYVPTAPGRVRGRGYDQAALIAKGLSRRLGLPYLPLLARVGGQRQLGQSRAVRKQQMADAFRPLGRIDLRGKHVLLVDDVLTTGATCEAAARTLRRAGAKRVSAAVFAVA